LLSDIIKIFRKEREQRHLQDTLTPPLPAAPSDDIIITPLDTQAPLPSIRDENNLTPPFLNEFPVPQIPPHDNQFNLPVENNAVTGGENDVPRGEKDVTDNGRPRRNVGTYKDGPAKLRRLPIDGES
jgi:hypothetical protein